MPNNRNHLQNETSPYLQQHKDNPVHWWPWCDEAFAVAAAENKPILLSIGYAACHWCHVMAHESFEDKEIASQMNQGYINIKVDREERPDIDAIYQKAVQIMGEQGGWPLTMVLTPSGQPFFGGTYFPKIASHGRPPFSLVLEKILDAFQTKPELIIENTTKIIQHLKKINTAYGDGENIKPVSLMEAGESIFSIMDPVHGGTKGAPKFPQTSFLNILWAAYQQTSDHKYKDAALLALKKTSLGGIYDHVGGGYSRYSTDQFWFAPHFEKMLYDNAFILEQLAIAYLSTGNGFWERRARETVSWLLREMLVEGGAFATALDADSTTHDDDKAREGAFYVWQTNEINEALEPDDAKFIMTTYGVINEGNWREGQAGENILHQLHLEKPLSDDAEKRLEKLKNILLSQRQKRPRPLRDHKILADWNGAMVSSLIKASTAFAQPQWYERAKAAYMFIKENMSQDSHGLVHSYCQQKKGAAALLDDYAYMARAGLSLYELSGEVTYLEDAKKWVKHVSEYFKNDSGGYNQGSNYSEELIIKTCDAQDGALPSGNGVLMEVLARLYHLTNDDSYNQTALKLYSAFASEAEKHPLSYTSLISGRALLDNALLITVITPKDDVKTVKLLDLINKNPLTNKIVLRVNNFKHLPANHPAQIKHKIKETCVILCEVGRCSTPAKTEEELAILLETFPTQGK